MTIIKRAFSILLIFLIWPSFARSQKMNSWGDQGNGTYVNPILNADYSDPDITRVGEKYYMVCSEFHFMGMPVLESEDMVNWKIIARIYDHFDYPGWNTNERYAGGSWAPSIRYHDGKFWVFFCTRHEGLFMANAVKPEGPWSELHNLKEIEKWEDPCPFWDEDGQAYLGRSQWGAGPIIIHKMSPDGTKLLDDGVTVYTGPVAEGTKIYKKDGYYYISIPEGGVETGWQTILRSKNIYGPYEKKVVLEKGSTEINGPHQGSLVETPEGELWFFHFQFTQPLGRVLHLQPAHWKDGWPVIGVDIDMNGIGEPVKVWTKPKTGNNCMITAPQTDDDFSTTKLGLQWQFNHNPVNDAWSLSEKTGWLTIKAMKANNLLKSRNMFTQKCMGYEGFAITEMDFSKLVEGQRAGLFCLGKEYRTIGITNHDKKNYLFFDNNGKCEEFTPVVGKRVFFKVILNFNENINQLYYSTDNKKYTPVGKPFSLKFGNWKGARIGLYSYNEITDEGEVSFNWFKYYHDGPRFNK